MLLRVLFFIVILIVIFLMVLSTQNKEEFVDVESVNDENQLHLPGSVHINGAIKSENVNPNKIRCEKLCFQKKFGPDIKEECIDSSTLSYILNNTDDRTYMKCLNDICIGDNHLKIINDDSEFKLKNQDKCYMRRDATFHGLGGNYNSLHDKDLNNMGNSIDGIHKLRRGWYKGGDRSPGGWADKRYRENMPGKKHDDGGQYFIGYTDGNWKNQPFIPNFVVGENCDEINDSLFSQHINTQKKNHFRFIKTTFEDSIQPPDDEGGECEFIGNTAHNTDLTLDNFYQSTPDSGLSVNP